MLMVSNNLGKHEVPLQFGLRLTPAPKLFSYISDPSPLFSPRPLMIFELFNLDYLSVLHYGNYYVCQPTPPPTPLLQPIPQHSTLASLTLNPSLPTFSPFSIRLN